MEVALALEVPWSLQTQRHSPSSLAWTDDDESGEHLLASDIGSELDAAFASVFAVDGVKQTDDEKKGKTSLPTANKLSVSMKNLVRWYTRFHRVCAFATAYNMLPRRQHLLDTNVNRPKCEDEATLGNWVNAQQTLYRRQKQAMALGDPRREVWREFVEKHKVVFDAQHERLWFTKFDLLKRFVTQHGVRPIQTGHLRGKSKKEAYEGELGNWFVVQQRLYRHATGYMAEGSPRRALWKDLLGSRRMLPSDHLAIWRRQFAKVRKFVEALGVRPRSKSAIARSPKRALTDNEAMLGNWLMRQLANCRQADSWLATIVECLAEFLAFTRNHHAMFPSLQSPSPRRSR